jgi:hypothetical protein
LLKLYEVVYVHLPPNGDYLTIFMHGWLAQRKGERVNWTLMLMIAYCNRWKKWPKPPLVSINNCSLPSSKSIILCLSSSYNDYNVVGEDES